MIFKALATPPVGPMSPRERELRARKTCLARCALVCRAWQDVAEKYLFEELKCTLRVEVPCEYAHSKGNNKLASLANFLLAAPALASNVRRLRLDMCTALQQPAPLHNYFEPHDPDSCPVRLFRVLHLLPRLETVHFSNISPHLMIPQTGLPEIRCLPAHRKLESLHIDFGRRVDNAASVFMITGLLGFFAEVRHLEIEDVEVIGEENFYPNNSGYHYENWCAYRTDSDIPAYCQYESISFNNVRNASPLLLAFAQLPSISSLKSLQLGCIFAGGSLGLTMLTRAVRTNLKHLQIRAICEYHMCHFSASVLQYCPRYAYS